MKKINFLFSVAILALFSLSSCEDVVDVSLENGQSQLVVDAFLSDNSIPEIKLIQSQDYFDNSALDYADNATVSLTDGVNTFAFTFDNDSYTYPEIIDFTEGEEYTLNIELGDNVYEAKSIAQPVPPIDTILYEFEDQPLDTVDGFLAEFISIDIPGRTDYYWIKHARNGEFFNDPSSLIIAQDAAFRGEGSDGFLFIPPIRFGVNDFDSLYQLGEVLKVELWSINEETLDFLTEVQEQSTNEGILATPSYNLRTNIVTVSGSDDLGAIGNFSVSKVSSKEITFE